MLVYTLLISHLTLFAAASKPPARDAPQKGQKQSKAGISWPTQEKTSDPVAKFFGQDSLSWHWNWSKNYGLPETTPGLEINADFVPTFFGIGDVDKTDDLQDGYKVLMGFNEPDLQLEGVAVLENPSAAAYAWANIAALRQANPAIKLVSPGVAGNLDWLKQFMGKLESVKQEQKLDYSLVPDYINVHVYATSFEAFKSKVEQYHKTFNLPVYVTEFAMHSFDDTPPPKDQQAVHDFMGQTTKWMDEQDWIVRYAWFGAVKHAENLHAVHPFNRLMNDQGELTNLGNQYVAGGHR